MSRILNFVLGFALIGVFGMSLITPYVISVLFTPPVSFGTNCEPAAVWSMNKLHAAEAIGAVLGMIGGLVLALYTRRRSPAPSRLPTPQALKTQG